MNRNRYLAAGILATIAFNLMISSCNIVINGDIEKYSYIKIDGHDTGLSEKLNLNGHFWYEHSEKLHHGVTFFEDGRVVEYEPDWGWRKLFAMGKGVYQLKGDSILADIYYYDGGRHSVFWKRNIVRVKFVIIDKNTIAEVGLFRPKSGQRKEYKWVYTFDSTYVYQGRSLNRFMKKRWLWKSEADRQAWLQRQKE